MLLSGGFAGLVNESAKELKVIFLSARLSILDKHIFQAVRAVDEVQAINATFAKMRRGPVLWGQGGLAGGGGCRLVVFRGKLC